MGVLPFAGFLFQDASPVVLLGAGEDTFITLLSPTTTVPELSFIFTTNSDLEEGEESKSLGDVAGTRSFKDVFSFSRVRFAILRGN